MHCVGLSEGCKPRLLNDVLFVFLLFIIFKVVDQHVTMIARSGKNYGANEIQRYKKTNILFQK